MSQVPLPEPNFENHDNGDVFGVEKTYFYTAAEMHAHAAAVLQAVRAKVEALETQRLGWGEWGSSNLSPCNVCLQSEVLAILNELGAPAVIRTEGTDPEPKGAAGCSENESGRASTGKDE